MKKCPFCAEEIQDEAIVCKHCGRDIPESSMVKTPPQHPESPKEWYAKINDQTLGPMTAEKVLAELRSGRYSPKTKLKREGDAYWRQADLMDGFSDGKPPKKSAAKTQKGTRPWKWNQPISAGQGIGIVVLAIIALLCLGGLFLDLPETPPQSTPSAQPQTSTVDLNAAIRFTGSQFVISNNDNFDWTNVKFDLNRPGIFSSGYVFNTARIEAGNTYTVGAMQFAKDDGTRFNPITTKAQKLWISCDTPRGTGLYSGKWQ